MLSHNQFDDALEELITGIDEQGDFYPIAKLDAHRASIRHRAVSIFLFQGDKLLLQQRAGGKYHAPLLWANSACSHPRWGETSEACAERTLSRELALSTPLRFKTTTAYDAPIGTLFENEVVDCFRGELSEDVDLGDLGSAEVADVRFLPISALEDAISACPEEFTPWFRIYVATGLVRTSFLD